MAKISSKEGRSSTGDPVWGGVPGGCGGGGGGGGVVGVVGGGEGLKVPGYTTPDQFTFRIPRILRR